MNQIESLFVRALHYSIDWSGKDNPEPFSQLLERGAREDWFRDFDVEKGRFIPSAYSCLFSLAANHFRETESLIDGTTLIQRFRDEELRRLTQELGIDREAAKAKVRIAYEKASRDRANGSDVDYLAQNLKGSYEKRKLGSLLHEAAGGLDQVPLAALKAQIQEGLMEMEGISETATTIFSVRDTIDDRIERYEGGVSEEGFSPGLYTGFTEFDKRTDGLQFGEKEYASQNLLLPRKGRECLGFGPGKSCSNWGLGPEQGQGGRKSYAWVSRLLVGRGQLSSWGQVRRNSADLFGEFFVKDVCSRPLFRVSKDAFLQEEASLLHIKRQEARRLFFLTQPCNRDNRKPRAIQAPLPYEPVSPSQHRLPRLGQGAEAPQA